MTSWCKPQIFLSVFSYTEQTGDVEERAKPVRRAEGLGWELLLPCLHTPESQGMVQWEPPAHVPSTKELRESPEERGWAGGWNPQSPWVLPSHPEPPEPLGAEHSHGPQPSLMGKLSLNWACFYGCQGIPPISTRTELGAPGDVCFGFGLGFYFLIFMVF